MGTREGKSSSYQGATPGRRWGRRSRKEGAQFGGAHDILVGHLRPTPTCCPSLAWWPPSVKAWGEADAMPFTLPPCPHGCWVEGVSGMIPEGRIWESQQRHQPVCLEGGEAAPAGRDNQGRGVCSADSACCGPALGPAAQSGLSLEMSLCQGEGPRENQKESESLRKTKHPSASHTSARAGRGSGHDSQGPGRSL